MLSFKSFLKESVIDLERKTFAKKIFDDHKTNDPKLKDIVKKYIVSGLEQFNDIAKVKDFQLIGSILTKKYRDDADLDINVLFDVDPDNEEVLLKLRKRMSEVNGKNIPNTTHPLNYFAIIDPKIYKKAEELADASFDIKNNTFLKRAESKPFDSEKYLDKFQNSVEKFDLMRGELIRDIIDLKELESLSSEDLDDLGSRINSKIVELESNIESMLNIYSSMKDARRDIFSKNLTPDEIRKYGSKNLLPQNVVFKLLEKYFYFDLMNKLKKIIGDDGKLSNKELKDLKKLKLDKNEKV
jgi:predicted nucleotidyltransferase